MSATTANSVIAAATRPVFYTVDSAAVKVALWKNNRSTKETAPVLTGEIGGVKVAGYVHQGPKSKFIQFVGEKLDNGHYKDVATAKVVAGNQGYPKLVITMTDKSVVWANTTKEGSNVFLEGLGLNIDKMSDKQEAAKAKRDEKVNA